jgi:hypothetical protein
MKHHHNINNDDSKSSMASAYFATVVATAPDLLSWTCKPSATLAPIASVPSSASPQATAIRLACTVRDTLSESRRH